MSRDQALAVLATCRHIGLNAWTGHVRAAHGERHVVCCRPAPGQPLLWLLSPADLKAVQALGDFETRKPVQASDGASTTADRPAVGALADGDAESGPAAVFAELT